MRQVLARAIAQVHDATRMRMRMLLPDPPRTLGPFKRRPYSAELLPYLGKALISDLRDVYEAFRHSLEPLSNSL